MIRPVRRPCVSGALLVAALLVLCAFPACASQGGGGRRDAKSVEEKSDAKAGERKQKERERPAKESPATNEAETRPDPAAPAGTATQQPSRPSANDDRQPTEPPALTGDQAVTAQPADETFGFDFLKIIMWAIGVLLLLAVCWVGYLLLGWRRHPDDRSPSSRSPQFDRPHRGVEEMHPVRTTPAVASPAPARASSLEPDGDANLARLFAELHGITRRIDSLHEDLQSSVRSISQDLDRLMSRVAAAEDRHAPPFFLDSPGGARYGASAATPAPLAVAQTASAVVAERLRFPAPAAECHRIIKERNLPVSYASKGPLPGSLQSSEGGPSAAFVIVSCEPPATDFYALPRRARLSEEQEYHSFFKQYYECASAAAGDLIIERPAIVRRDGNAWSLSAKGTLAVRA